MLHPRGRPYRAANFAPAPARCSLCRPVARMEWGGNRLDGRGEILATECGLCRCDTDIYEDCDRCDTFRD